MMEDSESHQLQTHKAKCTCPECVNSVGEVTDMTVSLLFFIEDLRVSTKFTPSLILFHTAPNRTRICHFLVLITFGTKMGWITRSAWAMQGALAYTPYF
jgi:hypothetical protein